MTSEEIKQAMELETPVMYNGTKYKCISAYIYRVRKGKTYLSCELEDYGNKAVAIVDAKKVEVCK